MSNSPNNSNNNHESLSSEQDKAMNGNQRSAVEQSTELGSKFLLFLIFSIILSHFI